MASNYDITMRQFNGVDYDTLYPKTIATQIDGKISENQLDTEFVDKVDDAVSTANQALEVAQQGGGAGLTTDLIYTGGRAVQQPAGTSIPLNTPWNEYKMLWVECMASNGAKYPPAICGFLNPMGGNFVIDGTAYSIAGTESSGGTALRYQTSDYNSILKSAVHGDCIVTTIVGIK